MNLIININLKKKFLNFIIIKILFLKKKNSKFLIKTCNIVYLYIINIIIKYYKNFHYSFYFVFFFFFILNF